MAEGIFEALRLSGVVLSDVSVVSLMDGADSLTLGELFTKAGEPRKGKALLSLEEFGQLERHALNKAAELAGAIRAGDTARSPLFDEADRGPCDYCKYGGICRLDALDAKAYRRRLPAMHIEDLMDRLREAGPQDGAMRPNVKTSGNLALPVVY